MNDQIDSLDHLGAITSTTERNSDRTNNLLGEEPTYQICPGTDNPASSHGAGGRLSSVVDPDFRPPTTASSLFDSSQFGDMLEVLHSELEPQRSTTADIPPNTYTSTPTNNSVIATTTSSAANMNVYTTPFITNANTFTTSHSSTTNTITTTNTTTTIDVIMPSSPPPPQQTFGSISTPLSFQDLARKPVASSNIMSSTLQQYGPAISMHQSPYRPMVTNMPRPGQYATRINLPIQRPSMCRPLMPISFDSTLKQHVGPELQTRGPTPKSNQTKFPLTQFVPPNVLDRPSTSRSNNDDKITPAYSLKSKSPPLDKLNQVNGGHNKLNGSTNNHSNRIPKKDSTQSTGDTYNGMNMLELQAEFRFREGQFDELRRDRAKIEKELSDLGRDAHGQNVELNPHFRKKKDEQKRCDRHIQEVKQDMKKISELLKTKYNHTMTEKERSNQPLQRPARAKMSTGGSAPAPRSDLVEKDEKLKKIVFDLQDGYTWCKDCDTHFESFKEYCAHLHKREHAQNAPRILHPPWRKNMDKIVANRRRTYDYFKSICAKLGNRLSSDFNLSALDEALNPSLKDKEVLKSMMLQRERGQFEEDDVLFSMKGYDHLVPVTGFFCKLCDETLCDYKEAEQHLKGYTHCYLHAKYVGLDSARETAFRSKLEKSRHKQLPSVSGSRSKKTQSHQDSPSRTDKPTNKSIATKSTSDKTAPPTTTKPSSSRTLPYKKPTSHIVDDHEVIADKFEKRTDKSDRPPSSTSDNSVAPRPASPMFSSDSNDEDTSNKTTTKATKTATSSKASSPKKSAKNKQAPEIVPIGRSKPSALKRLRRDNMEYALLAHTLPTRLESSNDDEDDDNEDEVQVIKEVHLQPGDPDSPFPDLDLVVTGNTHIQVLKDKRLARRAVVKMTMIKLDDYKDMMLDGTTLWARVNQVMTKKEPGEYNKELDNVTIPEPVYFGLGGDNIPVELDKSSNEGDFDMAMLENFFCEQ